MGLALTSAESVAASGVFAVPLGRGQMSVVAREDLADIATRVAVETQSDLVAGQRSRHAGRSYELKDETALGGQDIAEALGRPVRYEPVPLAQAREALTASGLAPYQVSHAISMFSNVGAGLLEPRGGELTALLPTPPRPVLELISTTVKARPVGLRLGDHHVVTPPAPR